MLKFWMSVTNFILSGQEFCGFGKNKLTLRQIKKAVMSIAEYDNHQKYFPMNKIKTIIVDDHRMFRLGVKGMLAEHADIAVVGEASSGEELFTLLAKTAADIVLLDIIMPGLSGVDTSRRLRSEYPELKILILSSENSRAIINELVDIGVEGFISKQLGGGGDELVSAIRAIISGLEYFGKDIMEVLYGVYVSKKESGLPELTPMEREIVALCGKGLVSKEIADHLNISFRTVDKHKNNIFRKLGINNTRELLKYAIRVGIVNVV